MAAKIKNIVKLTWIILIFVSCKNTNSYTIHGNITGLGMTEIYMVTQDSLTFRKDTIQTKNGKFKFIASTDSLAPVVIYMENGSVWVTVWAQNGEKISLTGNANYPELITIKGGEVNNLLTDFKNENREIIKEKSDLKDKKSNNSQQLDDVSVEVNGAQFSSKIKNLEQLLKMRSEDFVETHPTSIASLVLIQDYVLETEDASGIHSLLSLISGQAKETKLFEKLQTWSLKDQLTDVGKSAPDFSIIDTKKDTINLESFKDKYLLLTFAASWCSFCETDYLEWIEIRKKFSEKELGFLTISLNENAEEWKNLAKEKNFTWTQAIDSTGWASSMVSLYNISEIPCNYLIDKENIIIASKVSIDSIQSLLKGLIPPPKLKTKN
jgi:peroxiredoxin